MAAFERRAREERSTLNVSPNLATEPAEQTAHHTESLQLRINNASSFCRVTAGGNHFVLLTNGPDQVYTIGDNRFGQLAQTTLSDTHSLYPVPFFSMSEGFPARVSSVACGHRHSIALTDDGDCYLWGWSSEAGGPILSPMPLDIGPRGSDANVTSVSCAADVSLFLLDDGTVWALGHGPAADSDSTSQARLAMHAEPRTPNSVEESVLLESKPITLDAPAVAIASAQWTAFAILY